MCKPCMKIDPLNAAQPVITSWVALGKVTVDWLNLVCGSIKQVPP